MEGLISFPNVVCLLLAGLLVTHLLSHEPPPPPPDHPEDAYCCRLRPRPPATCSSPASIFYACASRRPTKANLPDERNQTDEAEDESKDIPEEVQPTEVNIDLKEPDIGKKQDAKEEKEGKEERSSLMVDTMVVGLLVCSAAVSLREWYRERNKRRPAGHANGKGHGVEGGGERAEGGPDGRRISLADLTFNRHLRRGEPQAHHHNGTPTGSRGPPPLLRRSSFPAQFPEPHSSRPRPPPQRQQSSPGLPIASCRRLSVDLDDDGSPDRRRVRIIRRH